MKLRCQSSQPSPQARCFRPHQRRDAVEHFQHIVSLRRRVLKIHPRLHTLLHDCLI